MPVCLRAGAGKVARCTRWKNSISCGCPLSNFSRYSTKLARDAPHLATLLEILYPWMANVQQPQAEEGPTAAPLAYPAADGSETKQQIIEKDVARGGNNLPFDEALNDAREMARTAYMNSLKNGRAKLGGRTAPRIVTANNLCTYWSGDDPYAVERSEPLILRDILSDEDIAQCHRAAALRTSPAKVSETNPDLCSALRGVAHDIAYSDFHVALYLHRGNHFADGWPELSARLQHSMRSQPGDWGVSPRTSLNVRCVELHTYAVGGALLDPGHKDNGSKLTMSVQLSRNDEFDGGKFVTWREGECVEHVLQRGDGLLFQSEKCHNVSTVERGIRQSLVIELWVAPANTVNRFG